MVSIVIPNYNGRHFLEECLPSVMAGKAPEDEIIVVDNGSSDSSVSYIRENFPGSVVIENSENTGFACAVNQGIQAAKGECVFLLNNDTIIVKDAMQHLLKTAIGEVSWSKFSAVLQYKAAWYGKEVVKVSSWYPSSQICSECHFPSGKKPLNKRIWTCQNCGAVLDRNISVSINIEKEVLRLLST
ncbi:MAG: hypothetical protein AVO33_00940 [delta proteobacterium ML8_F1]|nr:MAG: hypothetical protein AVO33_00940 [delta proteobacterium ML8_F1]